MINFDDLGDDECRTLLAEESLGRVGWTSTTGVYILPVTYLFRHDLIAFRTSPYGRLAELINPTRVAFQIDELDRALRVGRSVLVQGRAKGVQPSVWEPGWRIDDVTPWAGGTRNVFIEIRIDSVSGRSFRNRR